VRTVEICSSWRRGRLAWLRGRGPSPRQSPWIPSWELVLLALPARCSTASRVASSEPTRSLGPSDTVTIALRHRAFDMVWRRVFETFWDVGFAEGEWRRIGERYRPLAMAEGDRQRFHAVLHTMLRELGRSHFAVVHSDPRRARASNRQAPPGTIGVRVRMIAGEPTVTWVAPSGAASRAEIHPGDVLERVDTSSLAWPANDPTAPTPVTHDLVLQRLEGPIHSRVLIQLRSPAGHRRDVSLLRLPRPGRLERPRIGFIPLGGTPRYVEIEHRMLEDSVGYLRVSAFVYGTGPRLQRAVLALQRSRGMILDLRANPGGEDAVTVQLANAFVDRPAVLMVSRMRHGERLYRVAPVRRPYLGPLVILLDSASSSASEQFAAGMQALGRATIIGERTRGRDLDARQITLPTGAIFQYAVGEPRTTSGIVIEGRGVIPDVEVPVTQQALACRCDPQLSTARRFLVGVAPSKR